jgi:hypothetical protein
MVLQVGASKIDLLSARRFSFLDQFPKKEGHACQGMELLIGTAIFVDNRAAMTQRQDGSDWRTTFPCQADLRVWAGAGKQVSEPGARLREKLMASPGDHEQPVKVIDKSLGRSSFVRQVLMLGSPDAALDTVLV